MIPLPSHIRAGVLSLQLFRCRLQSPSKIRPTSPFWVNIIESASQCLGISIVSANLRRQVPSDQVVLLRIAVAASILLLYIAFLRETIIAVTRGTCAKAWTAPQYVLHG